mmetsp:Transcript_9543/g.26739  ORF Transcript_9543/g.26739 Transcript_9543/m.26739 type:complete len:211 (-) Transcript_9543:195-827(-)
MMTSGSSTFFSVPEPASSSSPKTSRSTFPFASLDTARVRIMQGTAELTTRPWVPLIGIVRTRPSELLTASAPDPWLTATVQIHASVICRDFLVTSFVSCLISDKSPFWCPTIFTSPIRAQDVAHEFLFRAFTFAMGLGGNLTSHTLKQYVGSCPTPATQFASLENMTPVTASGLVSLPINSGKESRSSCSETPKQTMAPSKHPATTRSRP